VEEFIPITGMSNDEMSRLNEKQVRYGLLEDSTVNPFIITQPKETKPVELNTKKRKNEQTELKPIDTSLPSIIESQIPLPPRNEDRVLEVLSDVKQKVNLNAKSLPSICMFTFLNSRNK
jgi:hypothetical protein